MANEESDLMQSILSTVQMCLNQGLSMERAKHLFTRELLIASLDRNGLNQCALAENEGVHRNTIERALRKYKVPTGSKFKRRRLRTNDANVI